MIDVDDMIAPPFPPHSSSKPTTEEVDRKRQTKAKNTSSGEAKGDRGKGKGKNAGGEGAGQESDDDMFGVGEGLTKGGAKGEGEEEEEAEGGDGDVFSLMGVPDAGGRKPRSSKLPGMRVSVRPPALVEERPV